MMDCMFWFENKVPNMSLNGAASFIIFMEYL